MVKLSSELTRGVSGLDTIDNIARVSEEPSHVRRVVTRTFREVAAAQDRELQPLADALPLIDCGLDSLCFAVILAQLEFELGLDPFVELDDGQFPVSFGAFVRLYEGGA